MSGAGLSSFVGASMPNWSCRRVPCPVCKKSIAVNNLYKTLYPHGPGYACPGGGKKVEGNGS